MKANRSLTERLRTTLSYELVWSFVCVGCGEKIDRTETTEHKVDLLDSKELSEDICLWCAAQDNENHKPNE